MQLLIDIYKRTNIINLKYNSFYSSNIGLQQHTNDTAVTVFFGLPAIPISKLLKSHQLGLAFFVGSYELMVTIILVISPRSNMAPSA